MNRRQEIACWIFGLLFALAAARYQDQMNLGHVYFRPTALLLVLGTLVVYSLRTRGVDGNPRILVVGLIAACIALGAGAAKDVANAIVGVGNAISLRSP